jgi:hypothetical protein
MKKVMAGIVGVAIGMVLMAAPMANVAQDFTRPTPSFVLGHVVDAPNLIGVLLREGGDPAGSIEMNVDGSATPVPFQYRVPEGKVLYLSRVHVVITDTLMGWDRFAGVPELTNGIRVRLLDEDGTVYQALDGMPFRVNADMALLGDVEVKDIPAQQLRLLQMNWDLAGLNLRIGAGHCFCILIQDDLSAIPYFRVMLRGMLLDEGELF